MSINKDQLKAHVQNQLIKKWGCSSDVFIRNENVILKSDTDFFYMCTFGEHIIIKCGEQMYQWARELFTNESAKDIMDGKNLYIIEKKIREYGKQLCGEHLRFLLLNQLPKGEAIPGYHFKLFGKNEIESLYELIGSNRKSFENALNFNRDVIAYGAFKGEHLVALAAADDYLETMWQIGIDTLPEYRGKGIATFLVQALTKEIIKQDRIPYYTTWSANLASINVALATGFRPVWVEYFAE